MNEAIAEILRDGGGILPAEGKYTAAVWGKWIGRSEDCVVIHFRKLGVPYFRLGDQCFYDAAEVLERLPRMTFETDPARKHGGNRRAAK
jgi:hypothetical protein